MNLRVFFVVAALFFMLFPAQADAHSLFNSAEEFIGGYRVQIAKSLKNQGLYTESNTITPQMIIMKRSLK